MTNDHHVGDGDQRTSLGTNFAVKPHAPVVEQAMPRELLYLADEAFFTGTATEVHSIRSVDRITIADGAIGPMTKKISEEFIGITHGLRPDRFGWLTQVNVNSSQPVAV